MGRGDGGMREKEWRGGWSDGRIWRYEGERMVWEMEGCEREET